MKGPSSDHPAKLFVETTTYCNLGCVMCVKQAPGSAVAEGNLSLPIFEALEPAFPKLEALVLNGIGEPLLHPGFEEFIRRAKRRMPASGWVGFQSNGTLLTNLRAISLVDAGADRVCLSLDGVSAETFEKVRRGGELMGIEKAFDALAHAKRLCGRTDVQVGVEYVLMRSNLHELPAAIRWAASRGASFAIVTHALPYDERQTRETLYESCTDEAVDLFREWEDRARRMGMDIRRYFDARWKYARNPEEERVVGLVDELRKEAGARGIFLDLRKLIATDPGWGDEVAGVLAEARQAAEEAGLELRLPARLPQERRRCAFVEEGSAFVSWDGRVSPCYFLWHRYRCFASGWEQRVEPRIFGTLPDRDILHVWNDPAFRDFRKGVLAYDYPACVSCSLAPCDYVQGEEFQHDCHIRQVPCGACLWCTGIFQCLR